MLQVYRNFKKVTNSLILPLWCCNDLILISTLWKTAYFRCFSHVDYSHFIAHVSVGYCIYPYWLSLLCFRQQLERLPNRRQVETNKNNAAGSSNNASGESQSTSSSAAKNNSPFLLARFVCCAKKKMPSMKQTTRVALIGNFCEFFGCFFLKVR